MNQDIADHSFSTDFYYKCRIFDQVNYRYVSVKQLFERNEIAILIQSEFTVKCGVRDFHVYNGGWFSCVQWWMVSKD